MIRNAVIAGFALAALSIAPSHAAPRPAGSLSVDNGITLVEGGCGPGGYRAANGYCYPRRPPPPPRYRECPPGMHPTPYGCRRNW